MIKVEHVAQDISLYAYACGPSKAMLDLSEVLLSPCLLPLASYPRRHILVVTLVLDALKVQLSTLRWGHRPYLVVARVMDVWVRLMSSLGPSPLPNIDEFINARKLPLSDCNLYMEQFEIRN